MNAFHKQLWIFILPIIAGIMLVAFGATDFIHDLSKEFPVSGKYADGKDYTNAVGYGLEIFCIGVIIVTPFSGIVSAWLLKIAYDLSFGEIAAQNVFVISQALNMFMAMLCFVLFFYSIYSQYKWSVRYMHPAIDKTNDKDLSRLI